jgi:lycopene beta-cyclase
LGHAGALSLELDAMPDHDVLFAGGGLASTLAAYRLKLARPELRLLIVDRGASLGGNRTWSFHSAELSEAQHAWVAPFVAHRWPGQAVRFPGFTRNLVTPHCSVTSERLRQVALEVLAGAVRLNSAVATLDANHVTLEGGERLTAACVIDGRGALPSETLLLSCKKFLGLELRLKEAHGEVVPTIMDADIPQENGYRFVYILPLNPNTILIQDTSHADGPAVPAAHIRQNILTYAERRGWQIAEVVREEIGALPVILAGDIDAYWQEAASGAAPIGVRACLFHPTTGHSLADAAAAAEAIAALPELTTAVLKEVIAARTKRLWEERRFYRMLNRLLFLAAHPDKRFEIMQRFYSLDEPLIERFYRAASTRADKARIMFGRPPAPILKVLAHIRGTDVKPPDESR